MAILNYEVLDFIKTEIYNIPSVKTYCEDTFNKANINLFIGADERMPPEGWDTYPAVVICPLPKDVGDGRSQADYSFIITVLIEGNSKPIEAGNVTTYSGIYEIETLSTLILDTVEESFRTKTNVDGIEIKYIPAPILNFPYYEADIVISFNVSRGIGSDCSLIR